MGQRERSLNYYHRHCEEINAKRRGYYKAHRGTKNEYQRRYNLAHREERREYNRVRGRAYYAANKEKRLRQARNAVLKRNFGITLEQYEQMAADRNGRCDICGGRPTGRGGLHVDHCHATGKVRGLLCSKCNQGLGLFRDEPRVILNAIEYLKESAYVAVS